MSLSVGTSAADLHARTKAAPAARREVPGFYLALTGVMIVLVLAGFWPYFSTVGRPTVERPWAVHLHGAVFSGWMILLAVQAGLVYGRRTATHRRVGRWGAAYGCLVLVMGLVATAVAPVVHVARGEWPVDQAAAFLILPIGDMILFGGLLWAAVATRRQPQTHKRYILLATVALLFAPVARLMESTGLAGIAVVWLLPVAIGAVHDLWTMRRIHPAYYVGTAALVVAFARVFVMESEPWLRVGRAIVRAAMPLAPLFA